MQRDWENKEGEMKTDIEIAQGAILEPITEVAERCGIPEEELELYG